MVANTIGAGIYATSGFTLADVGSREGVLAVWGVASLMALSGAVSFGALARALPQSGGEYLYLSRLLHPALGFIAGWISLLAGFAGAQAFAALAFARYLNMPDRPQLATFLAVGILIGLAVTQGFLVRLGTWLQNLTVFAKAAFMLVFIGLGFWLLPDEIGPSGTTATSFWVWPMSVLWVSLSFTGYNSAVYVAEECRDPQRDIPRALLLGTLITSVLYLAINVVFLYSAPVDSLAGVPEVALVSAEALGGPVLAGAVQALVLLSLFTLLSGIAVAGPRVLEKMGRDGFLPRMSLGQAAAVQCTLAVIMTLWSDLRSQLGYLSLTLGLSSATAVACCFRLPKEQRPLLIFPLFYILLTGVACVASVRLNPEGGLATLATLGSGLLIYRLLFAKRRPPKEAEVEPGKVRE